MTVAAAPVLKVVIMILWPLPVRHQLSNVPTSTTSIVPALEPEPRT